MTDQELERASLRDSRLMIAGILLVSIFSYPFIKRKLQQKEKPESSYLNRLYVG